METLSFNPFKSRDKYFLTCKIVTLIFCLPWPLTLVATVMSLAGYIPPGTPTYQVVLIRMVWLLVLVYPVIFFTVLLFAEKVLARKSYALGAAIASLPVAFALFVLAKLFLT